MRLFNGTFLIVADQRANAFADKLAKEAVAEHRVPLHIRMRIKVVDELATATATWVATLTEAASNQKVAPHRDKQASRRASLAAAARRRAARSGVMKKLSNCKPGPSCVP